MDVIYIIIIILSNCVTIGIFLTVTKILSLENKIKRLEKEINDLKEKVEPK